MIIGKDDVLKCSQMISDVLRCSQMFSRCSQDIQSDFCCLKGCFLGGLQAGADNI